MSGPFDRSAERAPSLAEIEAIAFSAFESLPEPFRRLCTGLRIHVDDFPDDETLDAMGCESEFDLLGLFRGTGLAQSGESVSGQMPNAVWLYRRPLLDYWAEHDEAYSGVLTQFGKHKYSDQSTEETHRLPGSRFANLIGKRTRLSQENSIF